MITVDLFFSVVDECFICLIVPHVFNVKNLEYNWCFLDILLDADDYTTSFICRFVNVA